LLREGWELGYSTSRENSGLSVWMQPKLCSGGKSYKVHMNTFNGLDVRGLIEALPRKTGDPFWMYRYGLKEQKSER